MWGKKPPLIDKMAINLQIEEMTAIFTCCA